MSRFDCVVMGNEALLVSCSETILDRGHRIACVVTRSPEVRAWAEDRGLTIAAPGPGLVDRVPEVDWLLSIANLDLIPETVLARARKGAVNFHDGPLPRHAGLNAPVWAMLDGEESHGIAWHMIEGGVDEGDILVSQAFAITDRDTALTLNTKAFEAAISSFPALLDQLETGVKRFPQNLALRGYHALADRPAAHGILDLAQPARDLQRLVRALDYGPYWNPLCEAKLRVGGRIVLIRNARIVDSHATAGTVLEAGDGLTVACGTDALALSGLSDLEGGALSGRDLGQAGDMLPLLSPEEREAADAAARLVARGASPARRAFADHAPLVLPEVIAGAGPVETLPLDGVDLEAVALWARRLAGRDTVDLAFSDAALEAAAKTGVASHWALLRIGRSNALKPLRFAADLFHRAPELSHVAVPQVGVSLGGHIEGTAVTIVLGDAAALSFDTGRIAPEWASLLAARLTLWARDTDGGLPEAERAMVLEAANRTESPVTGPETMHAAFEAQVAATPDATALIVEDTHISYAALNARANRVAHLLRETGVARGDVVGLCTRRCVDLMAGALGILKAGGAYLPMDPTYPAERLRHFVEDSRTRVIVTQAAIEADLPPHDGPVVVLDAEPRLKEMPDTDPEPVSGPEDLAYLIYTSGSTGKPKGVMVEHRNVMNFYAGMDVHVPRGVQGSMGQDPSYEGPGTWLAVTSLSFDISVLELFWTTARGFRVVMTGDETRGMISQGPMPVSGGMEFSLYYWGNDDGVGRDKYGLLLDGARFADEHGFCAVWTPERHFHAFGGPYPNPSVTGAAVAAVTQNIGVRGGSVVAPLHHPARIAEEWAVIDNLTNGRAGMAIASGWQPDDFVLRPENTPPANKPAMMEAIDTVRKLWRGEAVAFPKKDGSLHEVVTQPRPVSKELPVWVTTAGNPKTWEEAGRAGCNVLTHLLGQTVAEVGGKIEIYHAALREAGHDPADFTVTLMLHSYLAETREQARAVAREPMKDYLRSAAGLIKQYAWAFPAFKRPEGVSNAFDLQLDGLEPDELDAILDYAFERYFNDSGLFGTVEDALARVEEVKAIGVTEVACLIDYGIARETVLEGLRPLAQVVKAANTERTLAEDDFSIAAQIVRHNVSHLQCTPSMARMIAMNDEARFALKPVQHVLLGGEPLPGALVREFGQITDATITNMYGPTETTIWSSCTRAEPGDAVVNIGQPLVNQQLYVLDDSGAPVGIGQEGELWIGGAGVTRGYWQRQELTDERFAPNPFHSGRMYRTGDLVRRRVDGRIDFVGRVDHQVKLRGHRIELGEIEACLEAVEGVTQAVVAAREDTPGDVRLVGYYTGLTQDEPSLKASMARDLPAIMVPGRFVRMEAFPLTPNKKVDRGALPAPKTEAQTARPATAKPPAAVKAPLARAKEPVANTATVEARVAEIWARHLGVGTPGPRDNFFDLGGHSLLAVQVHRTIREELGAARLSITDIFRLPTLGDLSARVAELVEAPKSVSEQTRQDTPEPVASSRAMTRTAAMARRREMRARRQA